MSSGTGAFLIGLPAEHQKQSNEGAWLNLGMLSFDPDHLQHLDPLVLKAVSVSNWSKIVDTRSPGWTDPPTWTDPFLMDGNRFP